ncbi:Ni/Fe-hydrogenase cytochrome b subunit [Motiliproteus sp. MSK22-1]|uniref:Ni/Fe-hydrogenase cytochrome b subunit n=1 Tax=Motiliproteus sp. MSK22-1 TaxID=1897630 RepID=UPI0009759689|nr:Ni/Fe-hydrogenase cytochrome b subunit [Motiliproteus sp. MSK22-1]OMH32113.1 hydrogenase [Motiliproteus sp. MSK22-1]
MSGHHQPLNRKLITLPTLVLAILSFIALLILAKRFALGLGSVTNLNDGYPWGIWVVYDVVVGTGFACGGYALALVVYIANKGKYHPLVRPALLASLFGYTLGGISAFIDMGRYWNFYNMFLPEQMNLNSVMLEVGLCVTAYCIVLFIEFMPALLEHYQLEKAKARLDKVLFIIIAIGVLLPTMHQSSLGSLLIAMGFKVDVLWQSSYLMPLFAILTAMTMGFSIVIFEASFVTVGLKRDSEAHLLRGLGRIIQVLLGVVLILRFGDLLYRGALPAVFNGSFKSFMFLIETALFVVPLVILSSGKHRNRGSMLLIAAVSMLFAGALYRFNAFLIGWTPNAGSSYVYFPSAEELLVSIGIVAMEILGYLLIVKWLPILPAHAEVKKQTAIKTDPSVNKPPAEQASVEVGS